MAFLLLLYHIAILAPASANACATAKPIPAPAPDTIAVRPLSENRGRTRSDVGAVVLLWVKFPPFRGPSVISGFWLRTGACCVFGATTMCNGGLGEISEDEGEESLLRAAPVGRVNTV